MERERSRKKVRKIGEVLKALACCSGYDPCCDRCPYLDSHFAGMSCTDELRMDELFYLNAYRMNLIQQTLRNEPPVVRIHIVPKEEDKWLEIQGVP